MSNEQGLIRENTWRKTYIAVMSNPRRFGIPWDGAFVEDLQLAMDDTPLQYVPKFPGSFSNKKRIVVAGSSDKRQQMACPVRTGSGKVLLTQVVIRGKSKRCFVQGDGIDPNIVQIQAEKNTQTGATFIALLPKIEEHLKTTKRALDLPVYAPSTVLMDWAPCHGKEFLEQPEGEEQSAHLLMVKEFPDLWVFFAIPQKSHLCNPGDQLPNPSTRKYIQNRIRERAVKHGILVHTKVLPSRTKLDVTERTMKKLLMHWIGGWMHIPVLSSQITASWRMCLDQTPIAGSADEIEIPRGVICLGPPVELRPLVEEREQEEPVVPEAPEPEPAEDAEPAPAAVPRLDDPFAVDAAAAAAAVPRIRRRTPGGVARERDATRRVRAQQAIATPGTSAPK